MVCHECGKAVQPGQRFCGNCGAALRGVTDPTEVVGTVETPAETPTQTSTGTPAEHVPTEPAAAGPPTEAWAGDDPVWAATGAIPVTGDVLRTTDLPATEPVATSPATAWPLDQLPDATGHVDVWAPTAEEYGPASSPSLTAEMPTVVVQQTAVAPADRGRRLRPNPVTGLGVITAIAGLIGSFTVAVSVESDTRLIPTDTMPPTFRTGTWLLDDFADNLSVAVLVAAVLAVVGGVASAFGWRWGSGLAGGAGLAMGGLVALSVGLAQLPIEAARDFAAVPNSQVFTLTLTRDVGYWLLVGAGAAGVLLFFASLNDAFGDGRPGLNPWFAALGALATVTVVIGPMLPEGTAVFSDNWYRIDGVGEPPALLLMGRLIQLALLVASGVIGYLSVRRWGLGLAIGGVAPAVWLGISTLFDLTGNPAGPAYRNPGATNTELHGVTIIGVSAVVAMAILALVAAYDQAARDRRR
jgi:hypothetical protein